MFNRLMKICRRTFLGQSAAVVMTSGCSGNTPAQKALVEAPKLAAAQRALIEKIPYQRIQTTGTNALAEWQRLRTENKGWPIVVGGDEELAQIAEQLTIDGSFSPEKTINTASALSFPASLVAERAKENAELREHLRKTGSASEEDEEAMAEPIGSWPVSPPAPTELEAARDVLSNRPYETVHILIIPTDKGYEVPAYLNWGGWNACPHPATHVAALRSWHHAFGAELVGITGDMMNLRVARRPQTREEALKLGRDQYLYCSDIVDQGVGEISALAAGLMASDWWYFWWD